MTEPKPTVMIENSVIHVQDHVVLITVLTKGQWDAFIEKAEPYAPILIVKKLIVDKAFGIGGK
jgi:hypothetical protein